MVVFFFFYLTFVLPVGQNKLFEDLDYPQETVINIYLCFTIFRHFTVY